MVKKERRLAMEEKMTHYACACENMEGYSEYFIEQIKKSIDSEVDPFTGESVLPGSETYSKYPVFVKEYDRKYKKLKENTEHLVLDLGSVTTDFTFEKEFPKVLENIVQAINLIKHDVLTPVVEHLGPQVIEASRSTASLVELLRQKELDNIQYQQIVSCLVRWHVLDDLQRELKPRILNPCSYYIPQLRRHSGRPKENFYELADKERLRETLEALYQEKFNMTLTRGWTVAQSRTKNFLMAYILSLYCYPYGMVSAYHSFLKDVCGYTFVPVLRTLQNWFSNYRSYDDERTRREKNPPQKEPDKAYYNWMRKVRKYTSLDGLVDWIRTRLPHYGISVA